MGDTVILGATHPTPLVTFVIIHENKMMLSSFVDMLLMSYHISVSLNFEYRSVLIEMPAFKVDK